MCVKPRESTRNNNSNNGNRNDKAYFRSISSIQHNKSQTKMTTRSRQKLSSILAVFSIIALFLLLIFVWTAVRNGVFSNANDMKAHGSYRLRPFNPNDSPTTQSFDEHSSQHHSHGHHLHHQHHHNESGNLHGKFADTHLFIPNFYC